MWQSECVHVCVCAHVCVSMVKILSYLGVLKCLCFRVWIHRQLVLLSSLRSHFKIVQLFGTAKVLYWTETC